MFYHFLPGFSDVHMVFNVFRYLTFRAAGAVVTSLLIAFVFGPMVGKNCKCNGAQPVLHHADGEKLKRQEPQLFDWNAWKTGVLRAE